ncbi:PREDICTED: NADH dehydrogenase (ubiquinone) complex I, assembly factor 6-like isoform X2 [Priapulus caudatus]|uniref:NADH dehydrogenase (Ubiquinone) complex I, assembly factor 6-like isoform X2 n=1 Tax=Priapulus caudatus TaxID=37621 RepID=A0ABM1E1P9_PRICU|nr:PREDICTED: NADH dehydrogenase (ubiquinone) complex I, assembly factor 6-like isoform X2 [Priapulus caudatus]
MFRQTWNYTHFPTILRVTNKENVNGLLYRYRQVQDTVTNKQIGLMRLQFWKDSLDQLYKEAAPKQPVAMELGRAIHSKNLSRRWLTKLIEARERSLEEKAPMTVKAVEEYADCTSSAVMFLVLESVGIRDVHADHAASHLGKALGFTTLLRATPYHASLRKLNLPVEVLAKHKVSEEQVYRGSQEQEMKDAVFELASLAHQHLDKARSLSSSLPRPALSVFLPALVCDNYLTGLQRAHFNVFDAKLQQKAHLLPAKLWWKKLRGTY